MLDDKQKEFFATMEDTFRTPGWALLVQGWKDEQEALPAMAFFNAKTIEEVNEARVRYGLLNEMIALADQLAAQKQQILTGQASDE